MGTENTFTLDVLIDAPAEQIIDHLMQPENYVGLQPFVQSSDTLERGLDAQGFPFVRYRSVEHVPLLGNLRLPTPIEAHTTLTRPAEQMITTVNSAASINITFIYDFRLEGAQTLLTLTVNAVTPRVLLSLVLRRAKQAQTAVLNNLKARMEA
jgi:hypothetical protein